MKFIIQVRRQILQIAIQEDSIKVDADSPGAAEAEATRLGKSLGRGFDRTVFADVIAVERCWTTCVEESPENRQV